jgi:ribosomal RNA-processing protein 8
LNEELYTQNSATSYEHFQKNPNLFQEYHDGFRHQVQEWPVKPIDLIVQMIQQRTTMKYNNIMQEKQSSAKTQQDQRLNISIADFGCGEAQLAKDLLSYRIKNNICGGTGCNNTIISNDYCPYQVYSFDLISPNDYVTACDMAHVPVDNETIDIGIFCLSLMGKITILWF